MGSGGVAIAALPTVICLKVPFSDGLGGVVLYILPFIVFREQMYTLYLYYSAIQARNTSKKFRYPELEGNRLVGRYGIFLHRTGAA